MNARKILIADDDSDHLLMLALMLRKAGYQVMSACDIKNALQMAVEQQPDLLILDVHMGMEEGFTIQERLMEMHELNDTPVIYLTGDQSTYVVLITNAMGAYIVRKPFERDHLLLTISKIMNTRNAPQPEPVLVAVAPEVHHGNCGESYFG